MRFIGNLYLLAYLLDGAISVTDELLQHLFGFTGLALVRGYIAAFVFFSSFFMLLLLGIDARLPKRLFLPLAVFLIWISFYPEPFRTLLGENWYNPALAGLQLLIGIAGALYVRSRTGAGILLTRPLFAGPVFNWKRSAVYFSAGIVVFLCMLTAGTYQVLKTAIYEYSSGFVRLDSNGLYMTEKEYSNGNVNIRLIGMIHIGDAAYYKEIFKTMLKGNTLVLVEGVSDRNKILNSFPSYSKLANFIGLVSQNYLPQHVLESLKHTDHGRSSADETQEQSGPDFPKFIRADIDVSEFSKETIAYINHVGLVIRTSDSLFHSMIAQYRWSMENLPPEAEDIVMHDLITRRNAVLLGQLHENLGAYRQIIVPWGALHMPGIEKQVLAWGFSLNSTSERLAIDFNKMHWFKVLPGNGGLF
jgi:hypothetical protein